MSTTLKDRSRRYLMDAARAFEQAPVEVAVAVFLAVAFSYAVERRVDAVMGDWFQLAVACVLLIAGAWTGTLLHRMGAWSMRARWIATLVGAAAAVAYEWLVPSLELAAEAWRAALLVSASVLWVLAIPALAGPRDTAVDRVRGVNGRLLLRVIGALLYTGALFAGLALALAAIDNLFELDLEGFVYAHVFGWLFLVLAPWIVAGGLPDYVRPDTVRSDVANLVQRMTGFLVPPLLALYYLILYAYTVRIAVTGEIPKNLVSPMVLAAGGLAALALYLFEPRPDNGTGSRFLRFAPILFLPLAGLGIWTITLRVDQYGWTEFRLIRLLLLVVLGLFALGAAIQLLRRRRFALHIAPMTLAVAILVAAVGPWSVLGTAKRSQQTRLSAALLAANVSETETRVPLARRTIPGDVYDQLRNTARYLAQHFGADALPPVLAARITDRGDVFDLPDRIGLQRAHEPADGDRPLNGQLAGNAAITVGGVTVHRLVVGPSRGPQGGSEIVAVVDSTTIRIQVAGETLTADISALLTALDTGPGGRFVEFTAEQAQFDVTNASGQRRGTMIVLILNARIHNGALQFDRMEALLLLENDVAPAR